MFVQPNHFGFTYIYIYTYIYTHTHTHTHTHTEVYIDMKIEENNRMGKTRESVKRIREIKGMFHARMNLVKGRNSKDLTEREERWQEYKGTIQKKVLMTQLIMMV